MSNAELRKLILEIIRDGDGDAYSVSISEGIEKQIKRRISSGTIFVLLSRMEEENLITSETRSGDERRGFRDKTCYSLTGHGLFEIKRSNTIRCRYCGGTGEVACSSTNYMDCPDCHGKGVSVVV